MSVFEITCCRFGAACPSRYTFLMSGPLTAKASFSWPSCLRYGAASSTNPYNHDRVIILYCVNFAMVATDTLLYVRNSSAAKSQRPEGEEA
jgi:hypothetical protein